jgi:hypothetical protein
VYTSERDRRIRFAPSSARDFAIASPLPIDAPVYMIC